MNWGMEDLQSSALPLGYAARWNWSGRWGGASNSMTLALNINRILPISPEIEMERKTGRGFELDDPRLKYQSDLTYTARDTNGAEDGEGLRTR